MVKSTSPRQRPYKELGLTQLRSFREVCRLGGFAPAARALLLTTPAVWEQIKGLERHFGVALVERDGNRVQPTPQGRHLLELVQPLMAGLESIGDVLHQRDGVLPERLTIVSNLRVLVDEITCSMQQFRQRYPSVRLYIDYVSIDSVPRLVLDGISDIALTLEPGPEETISSGVYYEPAGELDYLLVTPPRHPLLKQKSLKLSQIVRYPLVLGAEDAYSRHRVQEVFHRHNLSGQTNIAVETSSDEYTLHCVRRELGVGIAVGNPNGGTYHGLGVRSLRRWFGTARIGFMWRAGAHIPPLEKELADILKESLEPPDSR